MSIPLTRERVIALTEVIPGWCWPVEIGTIFELSQTHHSLHHIEIGAFCGKSLFAFAMGMAQGGTVVAVDPLIEQLPVPSNQWLRDVLTATLGAVRQHRPDLKVIHVGQDSVSASRDYGMKNRPLDSIYIDGDHTKDGVDCDINAWYPLLRPGGLLFGHDYWPYHEGVMEAVNAALPGRFRTIQYTRFWVHDKPRE